MSHTDNPKPCPFCGADPTIEPWHGGAKTKRMVACNNDDCYVCPQVSGRTHGIAVERWNYRAPRGEPKLAQDYP